MANPIGRTSQRGRSDVAMAADAHTAVAIAVAHGLTRAPKALPPWLFYDERGSGLFEAITALPEYYLTRAEREIFEQHGEAIMAAALDSARTVVELGAGTAAKTEVLLRAAVAGVGAITYVPVDVSSSALTIARERISQALPEVGVLPWVSSHDDAMPRLRQLRGGVVVLFIGSSIGNYEDDAARALLRGVRDALAPGDALLLGTDLRKDVDRLVRAYDDAAGVTAAFNKNVLERINRELGGHFDPERFRHVALWNDAASRIEMHLESTVEQTVAIDAIGLRVRLREGERIHTESSVKYDRPSVDRLLRTAGFAREATWTDRQGLFAVHLARAR